MSAEHPTGGRDYKDTLNLPRTEFPMKGNLAQLEPKILGLWDDRDIYAKLLEHNRDRPVFSFHDGPPYANGHLHTGHAVNKTLKDFVVKYQNMAGRLCVYYPGWDCHGLPIELAVEKRLKEQKVDKRNLSRDELLERCREYALEFVDIQREEMKRFGVFMRGDEPYLTLSFDYEAQEIRELATLAERGFLYRQNRPVYWCTTDRTALAEAEVEYEQHESPSVYVAFDAVGDLGRLSPKLASKKVSFVIWTTTPWTLPANLAIAVHAKVEYVFYDLGPRVVCVAKDLLSRFLAEVSSEHLEVKEVALAGTQVEAAALVNPERILGYAEGSALEKLEYQHPFIARTSPIILGEHVTLEQGTGLVHTAPGHGLEDYAVGQAYGLAVYNPVKDDGRYDETVPPSLVGRGVFEANPLVTALLTERGALLNAADAKLSHSYPHCWRCHRPVIYRATPQWFVSLSHNDLRKNALAEIDRVEWVPKWGRDRIFGMLENRPDWCISRQRVWGVPIPVVYCAACDEAIVSPELMRKVADSIEVEGAGVWYRKPVEDFLPSGAACAKCGKTEFRKETDILDVWFDSACSFAAVAAKRPGMAVPIDLYLEGSDQHRGWFHSTLLVGVGTRDRSPYKTCLTHGFVMDGQGRKFSKSLGNGIAPKEIIDRHGAEILRLWVSSSDYRDDIRISEQILKGLGEGYRKIRNTLRYALSNLFDFDPIKDAVAERDLLSLDKWAVARLSDLSEKVLQAYDRYEFHLVYHRVVEFCATDLSAMYFDILKDRLYTAKAASGARRSAQTVLYRVTRDLLRLLAPVVSFTAEEAWQFLPGRKEESVFLAGMPRIGDQRVDPELMAAYELLFAIRAETQKHLEAARRDKLIGSSLEAKVVMSPKGSLRAFLERHRAELPSLLIVSQVELVTEPTAKSQALALPASAGAGSGLSVEIVRATGGKCPRCWNYSDVVGQTAEVCLKCQQALAA